MDEKNSQKKDLLKISEYKTSGHALSVPTSKDHPGSSAAEHFKNIPYTETVLHGKLETCMAQVSSLNAPRKTDFPILELGVNHSGINSDNASSKSGQECSLVGVSSNSEKSEQYGHSSLNDYHTENDSSGKNSTISRCSDASEGQSKIISGAVSTFVSSNTPQISFSSSGPKLSQLAAVCESNNNNNNNDKQTERFCDQTVNSSRHTPEYSRSERSGFQATDGEAGKIINQSYSRKYQNTQDSAGLVSRGRDSLLSHGSITRSDAGSAGSHTFQQPQDAQLSHGNTTRSDVGSAVSHAYQQPLSTFSLSLSESKISKALHASGDNAPAGETLMSLSRQHKGGSALSTSQPGAFKATLQHTVTLPEAGENSVPFPQPKEQVLIPSQSDEHTEAIPQSGLISLPVKSQAPVSKKSFIRSPNETETPSCNEEGGVQMIYGQSKSHAQHLVFGYSDESSNSFNISSVVPGEKRAADDALAKSSNQSIDSSVSSTLIPSAGPPIVLSHPKSSFSSSAAQEQQPLATSQLSALGSQAAFGKTYSASPTAQQQQPSVTDIQPLYSNMSLASPTAQLLPLSRGHLSVTDGKQLHGQAITPSVTSSSRQAAAKTPRKSRSRAIKAKSQKASLIADDDDDDDNDFIPVGMLQMSSKKQPDVPEGGGAGILLVEGSVEIPYQLNQGLNFLYDQRVVGREHETPVPGLSARERLESILDAQKQNAGQLKPKSAPVIHQFNVLGPKLVEPAQQKEESQQKHLLLMQLVQQAQQKQAFQQQQETHQHPADMNKPGSFLSSPASIVNQPLDIKLSSNYQGRVLHGLGKNSGTESEHGKVTQNKWEIKLEIDRQPVQTSYTTHEKNVQQSLPQQKQELYSQLLLAASAHATPSPQLSQVISSKLPETQWQSSLPNIPKIAERLLQQSVSEYTLLKSEQRELQPSPQQASTPRSEQSAPRSMTPIQLPSHYILPSVNQQHPEIARMLKSPVSPRMSGSPRQSMNSPLHMLNISQATTNASNFSSAWQSVGHSSRQTAGQSATFKQAPSSLPPPSTVKQTTTQQPSDLCYSDTASTTATSQSQSIVVTSQSQPFVVTSAPSQSFVGQQTIYVQLSPDQRLDDKIRTFSSPHAQSQFADNLQKIQQETSADQFSKQFSINNPCNSEQSQMCLSPSISENQPAESFNPGQIVHHRPPEHKSIRSKVMNSCKSQPSLSTHFPTPAMPSSSSSSAPVICSTSLVRYPLTSPIASSNLQVKELPSKKLESSGSYSSQNLAKPYPDQHKTKAYENAPNSSVLEICSHLPTQPHSARGSLLGFQNQGPQNQGPQNQGFPNQVVEMHLYPSSSQFHQPANTAVDPELPNSSSLSVSHDRNLQVLENLMEKETSLIQSLFSNNPSDGTVDKSQGAMNQTSQITASVPPAFSSSTELPKKYEDVRTYSNSPFSYQSMRKNGGGLKVLSEIASECYALAVAGKDDSFPQESCQASQPVKAHGTQGTSETGDLIGQPLTNHSATLKTKQPSDTEENGISKKKFNIPPQTNDKHADDEPSVTTKDAETFAEKKVKTLTMTGNERPRREVRQRKPKKPFEQEDVSVKRSPRNSQQLNPGSKRLVPVTPTQGQSLQKGCALKNAQTKLKRDLDEVKNKSGETNETSNTSEEKNKVKSKSRKVRDVHRIMQERKLRERDRGSDRRVQEEIKDDNSPRRLSKRLQVKEKERSDNQKKEEEQKSRQKNKQSSRPDHKETDSNLIEKSTSGQSSRLGRKTSITQVDDSVLTESPIKMTTRSRNRIPGSKEASENSKSSKAEEKQQKIYTGMAMKNAATTPTKVTVADDDEIRRTTRSSPKTNLMLSSRISPGRSQNTVSATASGRMLTRQTAAETEKVEVSRRSKVKRFLPKELMDEQPQIQKRAKKGEARKDAPEPSDGKVVKDCTPKENFMVEEAHKDEELSIIKKHEELSKTKKEITVPKPSKKKHNKSSKNRNKHELKDSVPDIMEGPLIKTAKLEDEGNKDSISEKEQKTGADSPENKLKHSSEIPEVDMENILTKSEPIKSRVRNRNPLKQTTEVVSKKVIGSVLKNSLEGQNETVEDSESEIAKESKSEDMETIACLKSVPGIKLQPSVIKSTSEMSDSAAAIRGSSLTSQDLSTSTGNSVVSEAQAFMQPQLASEKPKLVMYKIVPLLDETLPDLQDSMIPINGYFIPGGSSNRILLPYNFTLGSAAPTTSLITTTPAGSSPVTIRQAVSSQVAQPTPPTAAPASGKHAASQHRAAYEAFPCAKKMVSCSASGGSAAATTASIPPRVSTLPSSLWIQSSQTAVTASSATHYLGWPAQSSQNSVLPQSTGGVSTMTPPQVKTSASAPQSLPPQYKPPPSWNTTHQSVPAPSPAWNSSPSPAPHPPPASSTQHQQPWPATQDKASQDTAWSSLPATRAPPSTVEPWSKDQFPNTVYTSSENKALTEADNQRSLHLADTAEQKLLLPAGYGVEPASSQQPPMYPSNQAQSSSLYTSASLQETEFTYTRSDALIQGLLRQVSSNPGGFSHELAGFNLVQQDLVYLENRMRQSLSPNTLFSAVSAFDDTNGQGAGVSHDSSLQESINLVHTVNLDLEESNLDSSANLNLSGLGAAATSAINASRAMDGQGTGRDPQDSFLTPADENMDGSDEFDKSLQHLESPGSTEPKSDIKKVPRDRRHQYQIIKENDTKRYKCLLCNKNFKNSAIYRHLQIHDPDYKVQCSFCDKQYTKQQSLQNHVRKIHSEQLTESGFKSPKYEELQSPESKKIAGLKSPLKSPEKLSDAGNEPKLKLDQQRPGPHKVDLSKQQVAHMQVEELRRSKAEKKNAAAQRKATGHDPADGLTKEEPYGVGSTIPKCDTEYPVVQPVDNRISNFSFLNKDPEQLSTVSSQADYKTTSSLSSAFIDVHSNTFQSDTPKVLSHQQEDYQSPSSVKLRLSETHPQLGSSQPEWQSFPQLHADNIHKPISTAVIASSQRVEPGQKNPQLLEGGLPQTQPSSEGGKHVCKVCNTQLNSKQGYNLHMKRHSKVKTKLCSYCDKSFYTGHELKCHERIHTGEKPFKCDICYMSFAQSRSFATHKKGHEKRGENEPFPVVDGDVQYPPTFKKPRLSKGSSKSPLGVTKKPHESPDMPNSDHVKQILSQSLQTSVIRRNNPENVNESVLPAQRDFVISSSHQPIIDERNQSVGSFETNIDSAVVSGHRMNSSGFKIVTDSRDQISREYMPPDDGYSSVTGNVSSDYYSNPARSSLQHEFLPGQTDTSSSSSHHSYYQQDKSYIRSSNVTTYPCSSPAQTVGVAPMNLALEKNQPYSGSQAHGGGGQSSRSYYSSHEEPSGYHYPAQTQDQIADHQNEEEQNYERSLAQYKSDPSSTEIVKKLLQHYNVPASTYQESMPLDYSHQIQESASFDHLDQNPNMGTEFRSISASTPPPPPYSVSASAQKRQYYGPQSATSGYNLAMVQSQPQSPQDQQPHQEARQMMLHTPQIQDGHYQSQLTQSHSSEGIHNTEDSYLTSLSHPDVRFTSSSPVHPAIRSYSQGFEVVPSITREFYTQSLPKIESFAKERTGSPSTKN